MKITPLSKATAAAKALCPADQARLILPLLRRLALDCVTDADLEYCVAQMVEFVAECDAEDAHQASLQTPSNIAYGIAETMGKADREMVA